MVEISQVEHAQGLVSVPFGDLAERIAEALDNGLRDGILQGNTKAL